MKLSRTILIAATIIIATRSAALDGVCPPIVPTETPGVVLGTSVKCKPIIGFEVGEGSHVVLIFGAFHGGERMTGPFVERFLKETLQAPGALKANRKVLVVPYVNPDGWEVGTRVNANGVDVNRNFPTVNWSAEAVHETFPPGPYPGSEPETRAVVNMIDVYRPSLIISVHQSLNLVNFDGPARHLARTLGKMSRMRTKRYIGYSTPGSLGTYAGKERKIPTITLELSDSTTMDDYFDRVAKGLLYIINH